MSPRPRSDRRRTKSTKRNTTGIAGRNGNNSHDVLHLDSPLTDPDVESPRLASRLDYSVIAATNSLGGVQRNFAWFRPFDKPPAHTSAPHNNRSSNAPGMTSVPSPKCTEPIRAPRLGKGRVRKGDKQGDLVWPEHIEAALIEGLRLYHCTSSEDLHPSHTRNFGRNVKVSQFIKQKTGEYRSTRQISSRIQVLRSLWRDTEDFVLVAQPQELRRMGYRIGVRRPTPRAGPSHIPTSAIRRRTRQGIDAGEIQNEPTLVLEDVSTASTLTTYESATHPGRAQLFEQLPPQTDWTQDLEDLLLDSDSVSHSRSPTLSAPDPAPSYDQTIPAPSCDQPMAEVDEDFDLDELLLSLTGHEVPSAFPLSDSRNGLRSGLNPQLPPSIPLTMQQSPAVASDLRSIYQFPAPPLSAGLAATLAPSIVSTAFTSPVLSLSLPCIEAAPAPAQEPAHSVPSPTSLDGFAEHFFDGSEHPTLSPTVPSAPSLLGSGYATAEGSPDLGMEPYFHPGVAFHSTTSFDWTILAGVALPMHAEPSLVTDRDGEGMPDRSEGSESFEFVSPPPVSAINGDGSDHIEHIDSHDWWSGFAGLTPLISAPQPDPHCTLEFEQDQGQEQLCLVELSEATSPQVQIEPLDEQVQIDGDLVVAHAEVVDQIAEERQVQVPAQERGLPLHLVQPESMLHTDPSMNLTPVQHLDLSHPLSPPIVVEGPEPASSQPVSSTLLHCQYPAHQHATKKCPCSFRASMPTKSRQRKRKVAIDEDTVPVTDRNGNEDSGADMGGKKPMKRQKAESAKPRAKRTKELATKKNGVRVEETTEGSIEEPVRERMFVTTDETGRLKMLPVRTRVTQHDEEVGSSANSSLQLSQIQLLPLPQVDVSSSRLPQVRPIVPRRILPHPDTSHHATQPLAAHPQNTPNTLVTTIPPKSHVPALPSGPQVSLSAAQHGTQGTLLARPRAHPHIASPLPAPVPAPTPAGSIVAPLPRYAASCNHFESWNVGLMEMESESEAQILKALPPPIRRHQAQSYRLGTADTHSQIDVGQSGGTQIRYQQQVLPVYSEYSTIRDSACVPVPGQAHAQGCHQPKSAPATAPATAPAPLCLASYTHVETLQSQYYHLEAQQQIQPGVRQTLRVPQTQALQGSLMHAVPPVEVAQYHQYQHERRHQPSFQLPYTYDPYQCHHYPPLYSHQHPDASIYAQIPIEQQYPPQYGQESYISAHHLPYV